MPRKPAGKPTAPQRTAAEVRALIAAADPRAADALVEYAGKDCGELLIDLYRQGTDFARGAAMSVLRRVRFGRGWWQGAKRIYKLAEAASDAAFWGYLAYRIDVDADYSRHLTRHYMRRRAWRFLRRLARERPANYPYFAAEALIHYEQGNLEGVRHRYRWKASDVWLGRDYHKWPDGKYHKLESYTVDEALYRWLAGNILHRNNPRLKRGKLRLLTPDDKFPPIASDCAAAFPELWKRSPEPLLHVVVNAKYEPIRGWAIGRLKDDHAAALAALPNEAIASFLSSPHEAAALFGWHLLSARPPDAVNDDLVVAALCSAHPSVTARAAEFILWHRRKGWLPTAHWVVLAAGPHAGAAEFAAKWLRGRHAAELGWDELSRLLSAALPPGRALAVEVLTARPELVRGRPEAFLAALDCPHDDVRPGLCRLIESAGLSAAGAFSLLDLPYRDVSEAARRLIEKHLVEWNTPEYLVYAAESPDDAVVRWTTDMVIRHLSTDAAGLRALTPFFRRVLYRINGGGPVKRRLLAFLRETVERFPDQAAVALPLLADFTRSTGKGEFAAALTAAVKLAVERPDLGRRLRDELPGLTVEDEVIR
jgi:hypothetical protein